MKVSTDACIFGAWVARQWCKKTGRALDIGTGTGLLSLMLLQENPRLQVTALEPEPAAAQEAARNFEQSVWRDRARVVEQTLQAFSVSPLPSAYHLIICNPPFFQGHLTGNDERRNRARHDTLLPEMLAFYSKRLIHSEGQLAVIYPTHVWEQWQQAAGREGWRVTQALHVQPVPHKPVNRICGIFTREGSKETAIPQSLLIRDVHGDYTPTFKELMKPYYLKV